MSNKGHVWYQPDKTRVQVLQQPATKLLFDMCMHTVLYKPSLTEPCSEHVLTGRTGRVATDASPPCLQSPDGVDQAPWAGRRVAQLPWPSICGALCSAL